MLRGLPVTAVIPVRGGSKGIPGKNLYRFGRDTLLERAIKIARLCSYVDQVIVSTDDPAMDKIARRYDAAATALRSPELACDSATTVDVVLDLVSRQPITSGWLLLLQVTSPLRTLDDLLSFCGAFEKGPFETDASVSLVRFDSPHPDKIQKIENGFVTSYLGRNSMVPRQSLPPVYALNGAFYIVHRDTLVAKQTFISPTTMPFIMPKERSLNLDDMADLYHLETLLQRGICTVEEYNL
jgi:CMP-N,N'-diacetyllegionaminic acid synthase